MVKGVGARGLWKFVNPLAVSLNFIQVFLLSSTWTSASVAAKAASATTVNTSASAATVDTSTTTIDGVVLCLFVAKLYGEAKILKRRYS